MFKLIRIASFLMFVNIFLAGCVYQSAKGYKMMTWPYEQTVAQNPNTGVFETKTAMNLKALRTGTSLAATLALQNPWAAVAGAMPEAVDATAEIAKASVGAQDTVTKGTYSTQSLGSPVVVGKPMPVPPPTQSNNSY